MKKRNTYRVHSDGNILIRVEEFDSNKKLVKDIAFDKGIKISEILFTYDKLGNIISESQTNDDGITSTYYEYNRDNKIAGHRQLFNDEIYEKVRYNYNHKSISIETIQDDELVSKLVKTENDDKSTLSELFDMDGKLSEKHVTRFNSTNNSMETEIYNEDKKLITKIIEKTDENGRLKETIFLNEEGKLYKLLSFVYSDSKIAELHTKDYYADIKETKCIFDYNDKGLLVSQKLFDTQGALIQNCINVHNEKGDIIEESSLYNGGFHSAAGALNNGQSYRYVYEIEY